MGRIALPNQIASRQLVPVFSSVALGGLLPRLESLLVHRRSVRL